MGDILLRLTRTEGSQEFPSIVEEGLDQERIDVIPLTYAPRIMELMGNLVETCVERLGFLSVRGALRHLGLSQVRDQVKVSDPRSEVLDTEIAEALQVSIDIARLDIVITVSFPIHKELVILLQASFFCP